MSPKCAANI